MKVGAEYINPAKFASADRCYAAPASPEMEAPTPDPSPSPSEELAGELYLKRKVALLKAQVRELYHTAASPSEAGVLKVAWHEPQGAKKAGRKGFTGSVELKELLALKEAEEVAEEKKAAERSKKAAIATEKQAELQLRAAVCADWCKCVLVGRMKCKNKKIAQCPVCGMWKDGKCIKKKCLGEEEDDAAAIGGGSGDDECHPQVDLALEYASTSEVLA